MTPLPWFYVYSERYEAMHYMLHSHIYKDPDFRVHPIKVDQSEFAKTTYLESNTHFLSGCFIKQECMLRILKGIPSGSYFLFTDVDLIVLNPNGLFDYFKGYMDRDIDMVYMWENVGKEGVQNCNVGFALIKASPKTIAYFESVLQAAATCKNKYDMEIMAPLFSGFPGTIEIFDKNIICLSNYFNEIEPKSGIKIVQALCNNHKDYHLNMQEKYMCMQNLGAPIQQCIELALQNGRSLDELGLYE